METTAEPAGHMCSVKKLHNIFEASLNSGPATKTKPETKQP